MPITKRTIFITLSVLVFVSVVGIITYTYMVKSFLISEPNNESVFSTVVSEEAELEKNYRANQVRDFSTVIYNLAQEEWSYESFPVSLTVLRKYEDTGTFDALVTFPPNSPFVNQELRGVKNECSLENTKYRVFDLQNEVVTYLPTSELESRYEGLTDAGSHISALCLDQSCSSVGRECIFTEFLP